MTLVGLFLFVAFIVVPVIEIYLVTEVAGQVGWGMTIFLVIAISMAGAWLVKREGLNVIRRVQNGLSSGTLPTNELANGAMIFFASALMLTPGFLTDALGLAMLISPIRAVLRPPLISFFKKRVEVRTSTIGGGMFPGGPGGSGPFGRPTPGFGREVFDVDASAEADLTDLGDADPPSELEP